eukprot:m.35659 g.35659  ORF g.35659 m.35659 type:complete len:682 (-) comp17181_c1_seq1:28-2073(-)
MLRACAVAAVLACCLDNVNAGLHEEIYYTFDDANTDGVALLLNYDSQIGATSKNMAGDVGALYRISEASDLESFKSAKGDAYVALISQPMLANSDVVNALLDDGKLKGLLIYDVDTPEGWSAANSDGNFNPLGGGYGTDGIRGLHWHNLGVPAFLLRGDDNEKVQQRYNQSESVDNPNGRTLGIRLSFFMWAATNAQSCLRRSGVNGGSFCQPLGGQNVGGALRPYSNKTGSINETILISAQMDSLSLFHDDSFGAAAQGASLAAFIALARMVSMDVTAEEREAANYNVLFMGLQGEQFDHIGASTFYEGLKHEKDGYHFPSKENQIQISDIKMHIELGQMMSSDNVEYYVQNNGSSALFTSLTDTYGLEAPTDTTAGLPATSSLDALRKWNDTWTLNSVVVTDFDASFGTQDGGNKHMYTRHDNFSNLGFTNETHSDSDRIVNMCTMVQKLAKYVRDTAGLSALPDGAMEDCQIVAAQLLQMLLFDGSVQVNMTEYSLAIAAAANKPINRYVSVADITTVKQSEAVIFWHLSAALSNMSANASECADPDLVECSDTHFDKKVAKTQYCKVSPVGVGVNATVNGTEDVTPCWTTTTFFQNALSPAFIGSGFSFSIDDELAKTYSTWTESTWQVGKVEVFLLQDADESNTVLGIGLTYALVMVIAVWRVNKRFAPKPTPAAN